MNIESVLCVITALLMFVCALLLQDAGLTASSLVAIACCGAMIGVAWLEGDNE